MFKFTSTDLSSRRLGRIEHNRITSLIDDSCCILTIDLSNVNSMSESFSDECFGIIVLEYGYTYFISKIKFINASKLVKLSIANSVLRRKKELETKSISKY